MSKSIGELIAEVIETNIKIWHEDTKIRQGENLSARDMVLYGTRGRILNSVRSTLKQNINGVFNDDLYDDRKLNYTVKEEKNGTA